MKKNSGNTKLPYGLCERYGIMLKPDATPKEAWQALKSWKGITPKQVYKALDSVRQTNLTKPKKVVKSSNVMKKKSNPLVSKKPIPKMNNINLKNGLKKTQKLLNILLDLYKAGIII